MSIFCFEAAVARHVQATTSTEIKYAWWRKCKEEKRNGYVVSNILGYWCLVLFDAYDKINQHLLHLHIKSHICGVYHIWTECPRNNMKMFRCAHYQYNKTQHTNTYGDISYCTNWCFTFCVSLSPMCCPVRYRLLSYRICARRHATYTNKVINHTSLCS